MSRLFLPLVLLLFLLGTLVAIDDSRPRAELVIAGENEVFTLDPQRMSYLADMRLAYALYEGLLRWNTDDFSLEPAAVEEWSVEKDGRRLRFTLRSDGRWSDGSPVTAGDFAWSWMRLLLPDTAADYSNLFFSIEGAKSFWQWRQAQLQGFTADPWQNQTPRKQADAVRGLLHRFRSLSESVDRPEEIQWNVNDPVALNAERSQLESALASGDHKKIQEAIDQAAVHRALAQSLDAHESRRAEARWMWDQVEPRYQAMVGVHVEDDRTLIVNIDRPVPYFPDLLAFAPSSPVHRPTVEGWVVEPAKAKSLQEHGWQAIEAPSMEDRRNIDLSSTTGRLVQSHRWARPGSLVGNGPYQLDEWRYKRDMQLSKSPTYHDPGLAGFGTIEIRSIPDPNTAVLAFQKGEVDWLTGVAADCRIDMLKQGRLYEERHGIESLHLPGMDLPEPGPGERRNIHAIPVFGTDFFSFNCRPQLADGRSNPFAEASVRRGFALATDKESIVTNVTRLGEPVASTLVPPDAIQGYESPEGLGFDPEQARATLAEAGWRDRDGDGRLEDEEGLPFPDVELLYTTGSPRFARMAVELRDQWQRHLGVPVVLQGQDTKFFKDDLRKGNFMVARGRWYGDYGDPTTFLELCRSTDGNNDRGFSVPEVDAALEAAALEPDAEKRLRDLAQLEATLFQQEMPLLPVCQLVDVTMYDPGDITGVTHHPRLTHYLWKLRPVTEVQP
ncbi:MAG: peptide ABC transporter substrate-binding protein [Planctomycetota bacterium]|nr:peptide ABC transporter substrate-binding protein [Planctomycetota bacterium]